ncbi:T-cell surface glycoprotein CD4-like [Python bivittatus]|uniref:T-cell surface glycoprotein CD4-like n=1 Tax=Python bivittatus TaxID=176946 RepID=A0A9F5IIL6_PYTBI|nr:T-cell surface glycoprotein CD4-like [Python bivittatus]
MVLSSILVSFVLYLALPGAMLPVTVRAEKVNVIAGKPAILHCLDSTDKKNPATLIWKYNNKLLLKIFQGNPFKGEKSEMWTLNNDESFSLELVKAETGLYTCEVDGKLETTYEVKVWKVIGSKSGYLLQGDTLKLNLSPFNMEDNRIEWFNPQKAKVTGKELRWKVQEDSIQITNLTIQEDHGMWECHVFPDQLKIPYNVKIIGFPNPLDEFNFAALNSSFNLSCPLNINLENQKDPEIPRVQSWKLVKNNIVVEEQNISNMNNSFPTKRIPRVHFEDAGKYQCHLRFNHRNLNKNINLIVMTVSAVPDELSSKENVTLCGHIKPAPPLAELCWVNVNESMSKPTCGSPISENKFCHIATTAGLWRCDLKVNNNVKISINYTLGKTTNEWTVESRFPLIEIASGAGATLLLLILAGICVPTCKHIKRKRQQAKRIAQIKQHLLAKRTCQCQRELANDYYHT